MNSSTIDILCTIRLNTIGSWVGGWALHETDFPWWSVRRIVLSAQLMMPLCLVNQSIPTITSIPWDGSTAKSAKNTTPLKRILTWEHLRWHRRSDPGVRVTKGISKDAVGMSCFSTKLVAMNEWDAPESKSTAAGVNSTKNSPSTTPGACCAS
jgi:hypothetical protein